MTTILINDKSKEAKALMKYLEKLPYVKIQKEKNQYDATFIKKIESRSSNAKNHPEKLTEIDPDNIWKSIL